MSFQSRPIILFLILLSGFSALIYEVTWTRHLSLLFGANMLAVGTVTAVFMAGLAIGSLLFGSLVDRSHNPLRLYALLEMGIALTAAVFPLALILIGKLYIVTAEAYPDNTGLLTAARMALASIALLPPTICMGGTLPVICRFLADRQLGRLVGKLYALNTLGAVTGCLVGGFLLIPSFGMFASQGLAIGINITIAIVAWKLSLEGTPMPSKDDASEQASLSAEHPPATLLLCGVALIGTAALAYEMLWTRLFLMYLGNTTYAFSTILGVFLVGLTTGGAIYARFLSHRPKQPMVYATLLGTMLLFILGTLPAYDQLGYLFEAIHRNASGRWWTLAGMSFFAVALPVLLPATLSGALFPSTINLLKADQMHAGSVVGKVLFWNTLGAMLGSFLGIFAIELFGLQNSFKVISLLTLLYAGTFLWVYRIQLRLPFAATPLVISLLLLLIPLKWDQGLLNSGIYFYAQYYLNSGGLGNPVTTLQPEEVVEGIETTAAFFRSEDGYLEFRVNGKSDGGTRPGDMKTQILLGQLPMIFNPQADSVLVIGLGTGVTLRQVLDYPAGHIDCAEISPEVVKVSRHFASVNDDVLANPRINLLIKDGRNLMLTGSRVYDVIISEPSNPWQTGNANLFTREFYRLANSRLSAKGIFCQWLPLYDLPQDRLQIALKTFGDSFPNIRVFLLGGDIIMLGSPEEISLQLPAIEHSIDQNSLINHLGQAGLDSREQLIERYYFANRDFLVEAAGEAPANTDNLPYLEFTHQTGQNHSRSNMQFLVNVRQKLGQKAID